MDSQIQPVKHIDFVITGLPRSRTAWFANLFTFGNVVCFHDWMGIGADIPPLAGIVGIAETNPVIEFPNVPTVCIHRDIDDVAESLHRVMPYWMMPDVMKFLPVAKAALEDTDGLHIQYEDINKRLDEIMAYVGVKIPKLRVELLKDMKVETNLMKLFGG